MTAPYSNAPPTLMGSDLSLPGSKNVKCLYPGNFPALSVIPGEALKVNDLPDVRPLKTIYGILFLGCTRVCKREKMVVSFVSKS